MRRKNRTRGGKCHEASNRKNQHIHDHGTLRQTLFLKARVMPEITPLFSMNESLVAVEPGFHCG